MTELTSQEIREKINNGDKFLLDFYAVWCGPCRVFMKILSDSEELLKVPVYTYNVDTDRKFTQEFNVRSVPTVKLFDGGKVVNSGSGVMNINQLQSFVS